MVEVFVTQVEVCQIEKIQNYVMGFRQTLFPMLDHNIWPLDIACFKKTYLEQDDAVFLQAKGLDEEVLGVIGMQPYDHRFAYLDFASSKTVEVSRLFVEPAYRRLGIGRLLFHSLLNCAREREIKTMYLHTHPFLIGALEFWKCQGFDLIYSSRDNGETTWHMKRSVTK